MDNKPACPMSFSNSMVRCCIEDKCAWWNAECQKCAMVVMVDNLRKLVKK